MASTLAMTRGITARREMLQICRRKVCIVGISNASLAGHSMSSGKVDRFVILFRKLDLFFK